MNASEFMYWWRSGGRTVYGADPTKRKAVRESLARTTGPLRDLFRTGPQPQDRFRTGPQPQPGPTDEEASLISFRTSPSDVTAEEVDGFSFQPILPEGATAEAMGADLDSLEEEMSHLEREAFGVIGIDDAIVIGASAAVPAIIMAAKSKPKRLEALQKKADHLEEKLSSATGKKADRLQHRLDKLNSRIDSLKEKIEAKGESMGLYPTNRFVPADLDDNDSDPGVLGVRRAGLFGRMGDAVADEMFGSMPSDPDGDDEGPLQLWPAAAATADEGTILSVPATPDPTLDGAAGDGAWEGAMDFLSTYRQSASARRLGGRGGHRSRRR